VLAFLGFSDMAVLVEGEHVRAERLLDAQATAPRLFEVVLERELVEGGLLVR
jgi:hypothetical protein